MKKKLLLSIVAMIMVMVFGQAVLGEPVGEDLAVEVGEMFIQANMADMVESKVSAAEDDQDKGFFPVQSQVSEVTLLKDENGKALAYVLEPDTGGYVVTSADTHIRPVIAYSYSGKFPFEEHENNALLDLVKGDMALRLKAIPLMSDERLKENEALWEEMHWNASINEGAIPGTFWLKTKWHQRSPYWQWCPEDPKKKKRCLVGCVATAMAQIINYHKYPSSVSFGSGDSYTTEKRKIRIDDTSANASKYGYRSFENLNKDLKKIKYNEGYLEKAALSFACGISVKMDYTSSGSGTWPTATAFTRKFKYKSARKILSSDLHFYDILLDNMHTKKPALLGIYKKFSWLKWSGHAIVADGYNSNGAYHLNYGAGNAGLNWYHLPKGMPFGYNYIDHAIVNIVPKSSYPSTLKVTRPNGGEKYQKGSTCYIRWNKGNAGSYVNIYLYNKSGNSFLRITSKTRNDGSYSWRIPTSVAASSQYKIRVRSTSNSSIYDYSDKYFTITGGTSPVGTWALYYKWSNRSYYSSASWYIYSNRTFRDSQGGNGTWTQSGSSVTLYYSTGCRPAYAGKMSSATYMSGTMRCRTGSGSGKWYARKRSYSIGEEEIEILPSDLSPDMP